MIVAYLKCYLLTFVVFLIVDGIWLGLAAQRFYQKQIGPLLASKPNLIAAGIFYLIFIAGLVVFVILPGLQDGNLGRAVLRGALFGLVTYATYDLTNLATLKGWPILLTLVDLGWGTLLGALTTLVSVWIGRQWF